MVKITEQEHADLEPEVRAALRTLHQLENAQQEVERLERAFVARLERLSPSQSVKLLEIRRRR